MNSGNRLTNTLSSSVSYSKTFPIEPQVNLSITATHNQNTNTKQINMTLPTVQASVARVYPFEPKIGAKKGIIENINLQYNFRGENRFSTTDSLFFTPEMFRDATMGMQHSIPVTTNFKLLNYLSVTAGGNYTENWVFKTFERSYDEELQREVVDTVSGFDSFRTYNFNSSIGTTVYGTVNFSGKGKYQKIRHVMRPSISYNINPGFDYYYDSYLIPETADGRQEREVEYSRFQGTLYGPPGKVFASSIGFSLSNTFEAKVKDSIGAESRNVTLLNNLNVSTSYNLAGDSLKLSPISVRGSIPVAKKLDINFGTNLDIYALNNSNRKINKLNINNGGSLFRMTNANVSFGYSFSSRDFTGGKENVNRLENQTFRNGGRPDDLFGKDMDTDGTFYDEHEEDVADENPDQPENQWYNFSIPWDLRLAYSMNYSNNARQNEISSHSLMFSGNVEFSPKWTAGVSSGYDFVNQGFTLTQLRFARDLDSWRMTFNWTPFGVYKQWNFFIGIKSSLLRDIKYEKRRQRDRQL